MFQVIPNRGENNIEKYVSAILLILNNFPQEFLQIAQENQFDETLTDRIENYPEFADHFLPLIEKIHELFSQ